MTIKLVIADVDGTLVTRAKALTEGTIRAVQRLRDAGVLFTVTSGRPPRGLARVVEALQLTAPVAAFNGGIYVKPDLETVLAQRTVHPDVAHDAVDYLLGEGLDVWVYRGNEWYLRRLDAPRVERERMVVGFDPLVTHDLHALLDSAVKIVGVTEDRQLLARCEAALIARLGPDAATARSASAYVDITHPEANKGMVVREASRLTNIPLAAIATVGDMLNDVPMLKVAGMGIAMGNAGSDVQRAARHVTLSNENEGFAHAVDTFVLGDPPRATTPLGLPPRVRGCVFRLEGVLTHTAAVHAETWKQLFDFYLQRRAAQAGEPFEPFDARHDYAEHFEGRPPDVGVQSFLASRGIDLPEQTVQALLDRQGHRFVERLERQGANRYERALRFVWAARDEGLRTAVLSSSRFANEVLEAAGMADQFDAVVDAAPLSGGGPTADAYLTAAQVLGLGVHEVAVFEDRAAGVAAARAAHLGYVVGVCRAGSQDEVEEVLDDELCCAGADVVVADPIELLPQRRPAQPPVEEAGHVAG